MFFILLIFGVAAIWGWVAYISKRDEFNEYQGLTEASIGSLQDDVKAARREKSEALERAGGCLAKLNAQLQQTESAETQLRDMRSSRDGYKDNCESIERERGNILATLDVWRHDYKELQKRFQMLKSTKPRLYLVKKKEDRKKQPFAFEIRGLNHKRIGLDKYHNESDMDDTLALFGGVEIKDKIKRPKAKKETK